MQKKYRLTHRKAYNYVYRNGKSVSDGSFVLIYSKTKYGKRFGFSISRKVGKAVVRNKVRRRLKEGLLRYLDNVENGYNYIFIAKPSAAAMDYDALIASAVGLIKKAKLYNEQI